MPKTLTVRHWADVSSAVEIARSNVIAKRECSIMEKILRSRQTFQIVRDIVLPTLTFEIAIADKLGDVLCLGK